MRLANTHSFITYIEEQLADQCSTLNAVSSEITRSPELRAKVLNTFLPFWERRQRAKVVAVEVDARTGVERRVLDVPLTGVDGARQQQQQRGSSEFGLESAMTMSTGSLRATSSDGSFIDVPSPQSSMTGSSGTHARTLLATLRDASTTLMDFARRRTDWETSTIALCQHMVDTLHDAISSSLTSNDGAITSSVGVRTFLVESAQVAVQLTRWIVIGRLAWEREEVRWRMMRLEREQAGVVDMLERAERQLTWGEQE